MSKQWFILSTFTGEENNVRKRLLNLANSNKVDPNSIGEVLLPIRKDKDTEQAMFPGYVFAELDIFENFMENKKREKLWKEVCAIDGMIGFLGGDNPHPMSEDELSSVRKYIDSAENEKIVFNVGESVKILDGAFANIVGIVSSKDDERQIATVNFELFGETMSSEVSYSLLEKA